MFKAVIFDLDGVLIDTERLNIKYKKEYAKKLGYFLPKKVVAYSLGMGKNEAQKYYFALTNNNDLYPLLSKYRREKTMQYINKFGLPLKEKVIETLEYLKTNNIPMALATSSSKDLIEFYFSKFDLGKYFTAITASDEVSSGKPNPDIFLITAQKLGINPSDILVIEDSFNGLKAAKRGRFKTVYIKDQWLMNKFQSVYADYVLTNISLIKNLF